LVDELFSVTEITTFNEMVSLLFPATIWIVKFEWPEEVCGLFEVWSNGEYFMNQIFDTDDAEFAFYMKKIK